jgi:hypothetical protein
MWYDFACSEAGLSDEVSSPAHNPGNSAAKPMAKVDRCLIQGLLRGSRPKLELVTLTLAAMAKVATACHVHRERAMKPGPGLMQWTSSVPLHPRSICRLEPQQAQNLLHRDLSANSVEVDAWYSCSSFGNSTARRSFDRSVPLPSIGNGNDPPQSIDPCVANQRACGKAGPRARATQAPHPNARS